MRPACRRYTSCNRPRSCRRSKCSWRGRTAQEQFGWPHVGRAEPSPRSRLRLRLLGRFGGLGLVQRNRLSDEVREGVLVDDLALMDVDCTAYVSVEAGVEQPRSVVQRRPLVKGEFDDRLVGLAGADHAVERPDRHPTPLPLLDHVGVRLGDDPAHGSEGCTTPIIEVGDAFRDQFARRSSAAGV